MENLHHSLHMNTTVKVKVKKHLAGKVPAKEHITGTVPAKEHLKSTVPLNKEHLAGTLYIFLGNGVEMLTTISRSHYERLG